MFSLTIAFGETPAMWRLLFKKESDALAAHTRAMQGGVLPALITDDFGQSCTIKPVAITGCMLEDLDQSRLAGAEMMLHNARTQAQAQMQARTEPALRASGQGPSVFVPNGSGRLNG